MGLPEEAKGSNHGQELTIRTSLITRHQLGIRIQKDPSVSELDTPNELWTDVTPTGQKRKGLGSQQEFHLAATETGNPTRTEQEDRQIQLPAVTLQARREEAPPEPPQGAAQARGSLCK